MESTEQCDLCNKMVSNGPGNYNGKVLPLYGGTFCCAACWDGNHDGWALHNEKKLIKICKDKGISLPTRLANGLLPRD